MANRNQICMYFVHDNHFPNLHVIFQNSSSSYHLRFCSWQHDTLKQPLPELHSPIYPSLLLTLLFNYLLKPLHVIFTMSLTLSLFYHPLSWLYFAYSLSHLINSIASSSFHSNSSSSQIVSFLRAKDVSLPYQTYCTGLKNIF